MIEHRFRLCERVDGGLDVCSERLQRESAILERYRKAPREPLVDLERQRSQQDDGLVEGVDRERDAGGASQAHERLRAVEPARREAVAELWNGADRETLAEFESLIKKRNRQVDRFEPAVAHQSDAALHQRRGLGFDVLEGWETLH
ncbi:MAG: hypothetical protein IT180_03365 [Acidobacteria bacterium]|nr:hypothetical protein [Acidobacteriota bacterium]